MIYTLTEHLERGSHTLTWTPAPTLNPRTYLIRLTAVDAIGNSATYGAPNAKVGRYLRGPVVRLQGIDAGFTKPNFLPGEIAQVHIATDEPSLTLRVFHSGPEQVVTYADNQFAGVEIDQRPTTIDWTAWRSAPSHDLVPDPRRHKRPLLPGARRAGRAGRIRAVRRAAHDPRSDEPCARGPADEHVAGLQLPGRER